MCKCQEQTGFKIALRQALAATTDTHKVAVWENKDNLQIYTGTVKQAESRLKAEKIECYFLPKLKEGKVSFKIVDKVIEKKEVPKDKPIETFENSKK